MKRKILSLMLAVALTLGLAVPAMAYTTPDFSDVPSNHWAYQSVMKMADAGVIKGTGGGMFSPDMKLSAEMFVVLVGRVVFPDVKAEGADWSGPYVAEAKAKGLLEGTNVTDANLKGEISRYDMAVILAKAAEWENLEVAKVDQSAVKDYGEIPTKYVDAVLTVYGAGLIKGDQTGSFNGSNSMTRQEAATVMDRLLGLKGNGSQGGGTTEPEEPRSETIRLTRDIVAYYPIPFNHNDGRRLISDLSFPVELRYTEDGGKTYTVIASPNTDYKPDSHWGVNTFEFDVDKAVVLSGKGQFYVSGEVEIDGVLYATHDRRTDGRATIVPAKLGQLYEGERSAIYVEVVPAATGYKRTVTIKGGYGVDRGTEGIAQCRYYPDGDTGFGTGILLGEAPLVQDEYPGTSIPRTQYTIEFEIDTLDYSNAELEAYRIELYKSDGTRLNGGSDLSTLKTVWTSDKVIVE